jgi:hypothetical protein
VNHAPTINPYRDIVNIKILISGIVNSLFVVARSTFREIVVKLEHRGGHEK